MTQEEMIKKFTQENQDAMHDPYVSNVIKRLEMGVKPLPLLLGMLQLLANQNKELWDAQRKLIKLTGKV